MLSTIVPTKSPAFTQYVESPEESSVEDSSCEFHEHGPTESCVLGDQYPRSLCSNFTMDPLDVFVLYGDFKVMPPGIL
jgi:hypothetical protein